MARPRSRNDLLSRLADAGEDAISRLTDAPGMDRVTAFANSTRDRIDELTKRVRGIEALEERVQRLEKRVDELSGAAAGRPARKSAPARKKTAPAPRKRGSTGKAGGASPG